MKSGDLRYLDSCRSLIEAKLDWGPGSEWTTSDFEELSELISTDTGTSLGATTLKRIWGRVKYESNPSRHSLNILASYVGHSSWRSFQKHIDEHHQVKLAQPGESKLLSKAGPQEDVSPVPPFLESSPEKPDFRWKNTARNWGFIVVLLAALAVTVGILNGGNPVQAFSSTAGVQFSSRKVTTGLPNSVVFSYQLAGIDADSFFIQQSWDARLRDRITAEGTEFTSIYYYPGRFSAKLIANDTVLKEHDLIVPTDGWLGIVDQEGRVPIYADLEPESTSRGLRASSDWVDENLPGLKKGEYIFNLFNVGGFQPFSSSSVLLQSSMKVTVDAGYAVCKHSSVVLIGQTGRVAIPFAIPGCVADMYLVASDNEVSGRENDLSSLGADLSNWTDISIELKDRMVIVSINEKPAYQVAYTEEIGDVIGVRFRFQGEGEIRNMSLSDGLNESAFSGSQM